MYYPSSCDEISANDCLNCTKELGRIRSAALVHKSYLSTLLADAENVTLWANGVTLGKIFIYPNVNGEFDGGSPIVAAGFAKAEETLIAYNFSAKIKDPDYLGNRGHWNGFKGSRNYYFVFCGETQMYITERVATIVMNNRVANDLKQEVNWDMQVKWTDANFPLQYNIPQGVFVCGEITPPIGSGIGWMAIETTFIVG